ncbi:MAG: MFS transporter [Eubacteriaceae bacterium]|nr:MFS transporter [Eubacteriaceae bacterium]
MSTQTAVSEKKPLSNAIKTIWGIGDMGFTLMTQVGGTYLTIFLTDALQLPLSYVALCSTIPSFLDFALSAFYGAIIELVKPMRFGKYRTWLILTTPFVLLVYPMQYVKIGTPVFNAAFIIAWSCAARLVMNLPWTANLALMSYMAPTPQERVLLFSRRTTFTGIGQFIWSASNVALLAFYQRIFNNEIAGYTATMFTGASCMCLGYFTHFFLSKGYEEEAAPKTEAAKAAAPKEKTSAGDLVKNLAANPQFLAFLVGDFGSFMANFMYTGTTAYLFKYVVENMAMMSVTMTAMSVSTIASSFVAPMLAKKLPTRTLMLIGCFGCAGAYILRYLTVGNIWAFVACSLLSAFLLTFINITKQSYYSDLAVVGEYNTGKDVKGFIIGLQTFPLKLGSLVRGVAVAAALSAIGYQANMDPTPQLKSSLSVLSLLVPAGGYILTGLVILFFVRITDKSIAQMKEEIAARQATQA